MKAKPLFRLILNNKYMDTTVNKRINELLSKLNYKSKRAFAAKIGVSQTSFNDIINGAEPKYSTLFKIMKAEPDINAEWLLTGEGEMLKNHNLTSGESDESLYHFSKSYDGFLNIFRMNIKPQYLLEDLSYLTDNIEGLDLEVPKQIAYPVFCLCDIPRDRLDIHKENHGNYGIGFKKEWAIKNNISPLTYTYNGSLMSRSLSRLLYFILGIKNKCEKNEYKKAYDSLSTLLMLCKPYEGEYRYYDEKEWRWIPDFASIPLALTPEKELTIDDFKNNPYTKKYQKDINDNESIVLNFELDDIACIIVDKQKKEEFMADIGEIYDKEEDMQKIISLISYCDINGEVLKTNYQNNDASNSSFSNSNVQQGNNINDTKTLIELQKGYQDMIRKRDEQIDRLLGIIERLNKQ